MNKDPHFGFKHKLGIFKKMGNHITDISTFSIHVTTDWNILIYVEGSIINATIKKF